MSKPDENTLRAAANLIVEEWKTWPEGTADGFDYAALTLAREWLREHPEAAEGFEAFWQAWPRREAKVAAVKAWKKLRPSPELLARILADIAARWLHAEFIPHPATYLNGRRWEDEAAKSASPLRNGVHRPNAATDIIDQAAAAMHAAGTGESPLG